MSSHCTRLTLQCELCNRTEKDSLSYLDHLNSGFHLRKLGQSTKVARSTVEQVRQRIAQLREESKTRVDAKNFDFQRRIAQVREAEEAKRVARKEERRRKRQQERDAHRASKAGVLDPSASADKESGQAQAEMEGIESMMGFGGFGGGRKR
jgi:U4/U6.U5 tri-snRNP component SNU23